MNEYKYNPSNERRAAVLAERNMRHRRAELIATAAYVLGFTALVVYSVIGLITTQGTY